jgi:hypothetical protein
VERETSGIATVPVAAVLAASLMVSFTLGLANTARSQTSPQSAKYSPYALACTGVISTCTPLIRRMPAWWAIASGQRMPSALLVVSSLGHFGQ